MKFAVLFVVKLVDIKSKSIEDCLDESISLTSVQETAEAVVLFKCAECASYLDGAVGA